MTVSSEVKRFSYPGSGTTGPFIIGFPILAETDLAITKVVDATGVETTLTLNSGSNGYTVDADLAEVTTTEAVALGETIVGIRALSLTQGTDYIANDPFPSEVTETGLDRLTMIAQQLDERIDRSIQLSVTSGLTNLTFPDPTGDASKFLRVNSAEDGYEHFDITNLGVAATTAYTQTLLDDADASSARATLGLGTAATSESTDFVSTTGDTMTGDLTVASGNRVEIVGQTDGNNHGLRLSPSATSVQYNLSNTDGSFRLQRFDGSSWANAMFYNGSRFQFQNTFNVLTGAYIPETAILAGGSISAQGADGNFASGGNRTIMDMASGNGRLGSVTGGGASTNTTIIAANADVITCLGTNRHVGIKNSNPPFDLSVHATDADCAVFMTNSTTGTGGGDGYGLYLVNSDCRLQNQESGNMSLWTANSPRMNLYAGGLVDFPAIPTTAAGANAHLSSTASNALYRSTSSRRYKKDIEPIDDSRIRNLIDNSEPVWYRSTSEIDNTDWGWYGLIAEDMAEIEPALVNWAYPMKDKVEITKKNKQFDEEGNIVSWDEIETVIQVPDTDKEMFPDGVQYERLTVFLLAELQNVNKEIKLLRQKIEETN